MDNILLCSESKDITELSRALGFSRTLFAGKDFVQVQGKTPKELGDAIRKEKNKNQLTIYKPPTEELLRFALEKTAVDIVYEVEEIHQQDHTHYPRSGLDQVLCAIAAEKNKTIGISFSNLLYSPHRAKLLARIMLNLRLCKKYNVTVLLSNFAIRKEDLRSTKDLQALWTVLSKRN